MELTFKQFIEYRYGTDRYQEIRDACYYGTDPISKEERHLILLKQKKVTHTGPILTKK